MIIADPLLGWPVNDQAGIDQKLLNLMELILKVTLGANALLAVSMAVAKAAAQESNLPLVQVFGWRKQHGSSNAADEYFEWWCTC